MSIPTTAHLRQLAYERFDQDWDLVDPDPNAIIRRFARYQGPVVASAVIDEIETVLALNLSDAELQDWWYQDLRSSFDPSIVELDFAAWLRHIAEVLRAAM